jgi:two-component system sensor histidine kinase KdpD
VKVSAAREASQVVVEVSDDGDGVPAELLETLFEPFTRAPTRRDPSNDVEGAGLGLAITRGLVEAMNGTVAYQQGEPAGARFVVRLPGAS